MDVVKDETFDVRTEDDVVRARQIVRTWATNIGFRLVDQTKIVTAASELARNTVIHGGGGRCRLQWIAQNGRKGIKLEFADEGPGIPDIETALRDGYTTGSGLGLGLSGSKRLMHEFDIKSQPGKGTTVTTTKWM